MSERNVGPWRQPAEQTEDYPGLIVHDGRVSGSITLGESRLPIWCIAPLGLAHGWDGVLRSHPETYGWTDESMGGFLHDLLNVRGDFARLLLALANAERVEDERTDAVLAPHGPVVNITPDDPDAVPMPPSWWEDDEMRAPVVDLLRRCLGALTAPLDSNAPIAQLETSPRTCRHA